MFKINPSQSKVLATLYRDYAKELSHGLRAHFGDGPPDPDDVMQEAFRKVVERGDLSTIKNLKAFIWRTARNIVLTTKTQEKQRSKYDFEIENLFFPLRSGNSTLETVIIEREQLKAINDLLRTMPRNRRLSFYLYRIEGFTLTQVGEKLGITRTAVSKHLAKAEAQINMLFLNTDGK
ncbi:MAG: sigma-70 family RNA polymerase sigma factor [Pseudomonadota bacterium]